ncbi:hypothetical protein D9757_008822 [Collybiopsis confluens]|uniref:Uncharacterized protein n=1 Tax=Collybiopsis confluens TaxID=2823264 RepID=A0A8H5M057_9AGAR|nr:hypothetical protein D9757_008822 [Collybiopsis confluens]
MEQLVDLPTIRIFVALELSGAIGMLILPISALLSQTHFIKRLNLIDEPSPNLNQTVERSRTWFSFCVSWTISCLSYSLIFLFGKQFDVADLPSYGLCLTQATLIYASPPLTGATTFTLFLDVWLMMSQLGATNQRPRSITRISLLAGPYILWVFLAIGLFIAGGVHPEMVQRDLSFAPYCTMRSNIIPSLVSFLTLICALGVLIMLVILVIKLYRSRQQFPQKINRQQKRTMVLFIRLVIFSFLGMIALIVSTVFTLDRSPDIKYNLAMAVLPLLGVIVFGSQKDLLLLWKTMGLSLIRSIFPCARPQVQNQAKRAPESRSGKPNEQAMEMEEMSHADGDDDDGTLLSILHDDGEESVNRSPKTRRMQVNAV